MTPSQLKIEVAVTPRFDVFYSLYALTSAAPGPLEQWKEKARLRLPRDFERIAKRVAPVPLFWPLLADAVQTPAGELAFDGILDGLRGMPVDELKSNILSGIFHDHATVRSLVARKKSLRQVLTDVALPGGELLVHFGLRPYTSQSAAADAISRLLSDPNGFRDELRLILERFWRTGFRSDWNALEPALREDAERIRTASSRNDPGAFAGELNLPVTVDERAGEMKPRSGSAIKFARVDCCYIIPSAFNTRRWWAKYESKAGRMSIYFPVLSSAVSANALAGDDWQQDVPPRITAAPDRAAKINAEIVFRALGDTTRYAIASILARAPTTSADLARALKVSKPTITHHVQALRSAGLIIESAEGGSTKLTLDRNTIAAVSSAALEQLFAQTGDLTLLTTRKRRQ